MKNITFKPLAFESLGVRSMASTVITPDLKILIDPGASLGIRFGLLPHPEEYRIRSKLRKVISEEGKKADIITISHYHQDHYTPNYVENILIGSNPEEARHIVQDKVLIIKDYRSNINVSQRKRGWFFKRFAARYAKKILTADGNEFQFGSTILKFSQPVLHGEADSGLGWVVMLTIRYDEEKITFASDIQGPIVENNLNTILNEKPELLILGGPPLYLKGNKLKNKSLENAKKNILKISEEIPTTIIDHHLMRSSDCIEFLLPARSVAQSKGHTLQSAAEFTFVKNRLLESKREELYNIKPPSSEFLAWAKLPKEKQRVQPPPI
jgi:predicted metallo-beta-lactamase superfamily hydrolase